MINSYSLSKLVPVDTPLDFDTTRILTGCTVTHLDGSPTFTLTKPGYYYVTFNATVAATATGNVVAQLLNGADEIPAAASSTTIATAGDLYPISFATIIRVLPSCCAIDNTTKLTIVNQGIEATYTDAEINITKLC